MQKKIVIVLLILQALFSGAQEAIVTFRPKTPASAIDSIRIINQMTGKSVLIGGADTLWLLDPAVGIQNFPNQPDNEEIVFPNPFTDKTRVHFSTEGTQTVKMDLWTISGQKLISKSMVLKQGRHSFEIGVENPGSYLATIRSNKGLSTKLIICQRSGKTSDHITYFGSDQNLTQDQTRVKSAVISKITFQNGTNLLFKVYSGKNQTVFVDSPQGIKTYTMDFYPCIDHDNRNYAAIKIGDQVWMAENMAWLPKVNPPGVFSMFEKCYYVMGYNGTDVLQAKMRPEYQQYGVLYNFPAAANGEKPADPDTVRIRGICPEGWHLPTDKEWQKLEIFIGFTPSEAASTMDNRGWGLGDAIKSVNGWDAYMINKDTNRTGFSSLPGGLLRPYEFTNKGYAASWWTTTQLGSDSNIDRILYIDNKISKSFIFHEYGLSIRCIKNTE